MEQKPRRVYRDWLEQKTTEWRERRIFCLPRNGRDHSSDDIRDNFIRLGTPFVRKPPKGTMIKWFAIICAADLTWRTVHYMVPNRTPESPLRRLRNRARNRAMAQLLHFESVRSAYVGRGASCPLPQSSNSWVCPSSLPSRSRVRGLASSTRPATKGWATTATAARTISLPKCLRILRCSEHTRTDDGRARLQV